MSSPIKSIAIVGLCLLLVGCAPTTGIKSFIAIIGMLISVGAAVWGLSHTREQDRVVHKGELLDQQVTEHERRYHGKV